jgi:hypothetical protein
LHRDIRFDAIVLDSARNNSYPDDLEQAGMKKVDYWDPTFEDMLTCIARLPRIAALIYRHVFRNGDITKLVRNCMSQSAHV